MFERPYNPSPSRSIRLFSQQLALSFAAIIVSIGMGVETQPLVRELFVPFSDLDVVLKGGGRRVFLTRREYDELLTKASISKEEPAPHPISILATNYQGNLETTRATLRGDILIDVAASGVHPITLPLNGIGLLSATLDGVPAPMSQPQEGMSQLFVEGQGRHQLVLDMVVPVSSAAAQQTVSFELPQAGAGRFVLTAPGNVDIKSGVAVLRRTSNPENTTFEFLPQPGPTTLILNLNDQQTDQQQIVVAHTVQVDELTETYERLHVTASMEIPYGVTERFRFRIPDGFDVTDVKSPRLSRWQVQTETGDAVLEVLLREPSGGAEVLNISAQRSTPDLAAWSMPSLEPLDVAGTVSVVGVLVQEQLETKTLAASGLIPIDIDMLTTALPPSIFAAEPGAPALTPVVAYFSPDSQFDLQATFVRPASRLEVTSNRVLALSDSGLELNAGITLTAQADKTFECNLLLDGVWQVNRVRDYQDGPLMFELHTATDGRTRVQVKLPQGIAPGESFILQLNATNTPAGWLDSWDTQAIEFPNIEVLEATVHRGALGVQVDDDLTVQDDATTGLRPLDENEKARHNLASTTVALAYEFEAMPVSATFTVQRVSSKITAETYSFLKIEPAHLENHFELVYDVAAARTRQVAFYLPTGTPDEIRIEGIENVKVKETSFSDDPSGRRWDVSLVTPLKGSIRLRVVFEQPWDSPSASAGDANTTTQAKSLVLPIIRAADVQYQTGSVSVEGSSQLEIALDTLARRIDVGELIDAEYQPGRRLLGAYGFVGEPTGVTANVTRPDQYGLPAAIIERGELISALSAAGISQTAARFHLRTKAQFLEIQLPQSSTLWSVYLDGVPAKPQRNGDRLLISMPGLQNSVLRNLQFVYETPTRALGMWGDVEVGAPKLFLREDPELASVEVPMADLDWHVALPSGYQLSGSSGNVFLNPGDYQTQFLLGTGFTPMGSVAKGIVQSTTGGAGNAANVAAPMAIREGIESKSAEMQSDLPQPKYMFGDIPSDVESLTEPGGPPTANTATLGDETPDSAAQPQLSVPQIAQGRQAGESDGLLESRPLTEMAGKDHGKYWALEGLRSLKIDLTNSDQRIAFQSLGHNPVLGVSVVDRHRLELLGWGLALLVVTIGLCLVNVSFAAKFRYLGFVLLLATVLPLVLDWEGQKSRVTDLMFFAGLSLIPMYCVLGMARKLVSPLMANPTVAASLLLGFLVLIPEDVQAQATDLHQPNNVVEAQVGSIRVKLIGPDTPVKIPKDVVIVPYDPNQEKLQESSDKVIVPYQKYVELWDLAFPNQKMQLVPPPTEAAWSGAIWTTTLTDDESLLVEGILELDTFVDGIVAIPISLAGGVLEKALLDEAPARIAGPENLPLQTARAPSAQRAATRDDSVSKLLVSTKGRHRLELSIRYRLTRQGGWRVVDGIIPYTPASTLSIRVPSANTELRLPGQTDTSTFETKADSQTIATSLGPGGQFKMQWRPRVSHAAVDRSLTVKSDAVVDIQEDGLRLVWQLDFLFPRATRELFSIKVPEEYLVERVTGDNIRGWQRKDEQVDVTLLSQVRDQQQLTLHLARRGAMGRGDLQNIDAPVIEVPDAVLHEGRIAARRSPLLDVQTLATEGLVRTDISSVQTAQNTKSDSPLGIHPYQAYRFSRTPYRLSFSAKPLSSDMSAEIQSVARATNATRTLETRVQIRTSARPVYHVQLRLPAGFELTSLSTSGAFQSSLSDHESGQKTLSIYLGSGQTGEFPIILTGKLPNADDDAMLVELPQVSVQGVSKQVSTIVVQTDPSFDARVDQLENCEQVLLDRAYDWLGKNQRQLARLAIRAEDGNFQGTVRLQPRSPQIHCRTVSNLRVTSRSFEETILLDFSVEDAGVRQISFLLPADMKDATINVPLLRRKTIEEISADQIRVRLELRDDVMGEIRVLVQHDRLVTSNERGVPIPVIETGSTEEQFVALESAGRDEVVVARSNEVEPLGRQQRQWKVLAELLGDQVTQAFLVSGQAPLLVVQTKDRQAVTTVGARIAFAETLLVLDRSGTYRGKQSYRVDNRTEQFLEIEIPQGAELWTAQVAGQPVKPITGNGSVRIPLVKTAEGDQDYAVELKYGGQIDRFRQFREVNFPLMLTKNINVEESQVRLRLPESQSWMNFDGSMRQVEQADLRAGYLKYKTKQLASWSSGLSSKNPFARARARSNLKSAMSLGIEGDIRADNAELRKQRDVHQRAVEMAMRQLAEQAETEQSQTDARYFGNSGNMRRRYADQAVTNSSNAVNEIGSNFYFAEEQNDDQSKQVDGKLQQEWIDNNRLSNEDGKESSRINMAGTATWGKKMANDRSGENGVAEGGGGYGAGGGGYGRGGMGGYGGGYGGGASDGEYGANGAKAEGADSGYGSAYGGGEGFEESGDANSQALDYQVQQTQPNTVDKILRFEQKLANKDNLSTFNNADGQSQQGADLFDNDFAVTTDQPAQSGFRNVGTTPLSGGMSATGWASLDVNLPVRGQEFLFTTPRGEIEITARPVSISLVQRTWRLAMVGLALLAITIAYRVSTSSRSNTPRHSSSHDRPQ